MNGRGWDRTSNRPRVESSADVAAESIFSVPSPTRSNRYANRRIATPMRELRPETPTRSACTAGCTSPDSRSPSPVPALPRYRYRQINRRLLNEVGLDLVARVHRQLAATRPRTITLPPGKHPPRVRARRQRHHGAVLVRQRAGRRAIDPRPRHTAAPGHRHEQALIQRADGMRTAGPRDQTEPRQRTHHDQPDAGPATDDRVSPPGRQPGGATREWS